MSNSVFGPFGAITVVSGSTPMNATWGNNAQLQSEIAINTLNPDLSGPFVLSGITCTKDGSVANQLDIASGTAYAVVGDGTVAKILVSADNTHTTSTPTSIYFLYLQPDGTWYWSTSNSPATNSLPIAQVSTDGSGNISTVADVRHGTANLGQSLVVARALHVAITTTAGNTFLTYVPSVRGFYRVSGYCSYTNPTPQKIIFTVQSYDVDLATFVGESFMAISPSAIAGQVLNGAQASTPGNNQAIATMPITVYQEAGKHISVTFTDGGGTPADHVSAIIERLA